MLCGDQAPVFTREEILKFTEPKLGYTKDSPGFQRSVSCSFVLSASTGSISAIVRRHNRWKAQMDYTR